MFIFFFFFFSSRRRHTRFSRDWSSDVCSSDLVTTTFNGYFAAVVAGASANCKLRRGTIGVRAGASVPTSQQMTVAMYRQTVRVVGTGFTTVVGSNMDPRGAASAISGVDFTTAATAGTT